MEKNQNIPLVSIALATYNGEKYLQQQIDSLLAQTYQNIEIVISDDGSNDNTLKIIEDYCYKNKNIFLFKNTISTGVNKNFEHAIKNCKGDFIALCDQDDYWLPEKIALLVNNIGDNTLIYHNSLFIDSEGNSMNRTIADKMNCYSGTDSKSFLLFNCVSGHVCMFKKALLQTALPFPEIKFFDWWLAFMATQNTGIKYLPENLVHYRQHNASVTDMLALKETTTHKKEFTIYTQELNWFKSCAKFAVNEKLFFEHWFALYKKRENQWFSISLFLLALKNTNSLYVLKKKNGLSKFFECLKLLWGLKLKKLIG